jgi:hypothetical protein
VLFIIIGKTAIFEQQPSLKDSARLNPVFTSLDFVTVILFLTEQGLQPCVQLPSLEVSVLLLEKK